MSFNNKSKVGLVALAVMLSACGDNKVAEPVVAEEVVVTEEVVTEAGSISTTVDEVVAPEDKPHLSATNRRTVNAEVATIDQETRMVGLQVVDGELVNIKVGEEVTNLGNVNVGDRVTVEFIENITIDVYSTDNAEVGIAAGAAVARTEGATMPATFAIAKQVVVYAVEEINIEANTFKLKGPDGITKEYVARDPENLKRSAVGDVVVVSHTEVMAVSVDVNVLEEAAEVEAEIEVEAAMEEEVADLKADIKADLKEEVAEAEAAAAK